MFMIFYACSITLAFIIAMCGVMLHYRKVFEDLSYYPEWHRAVTKARAAYHEALEWVIGAYGLLCLAGYMAYLINTWGA